MGKTEEKLSARKQHAIAQREKIADLYTKYSGNVAAIAREMGLVRSTVGEHLKVLGIKKPLAGGKQQAKTHKAPLPETGNITRYILTSAQNNTYVHEGFWDNVQAMAKHYNAQILVGTFSYNQNNFGALAVKEGTKKAYEKELWFDPAITPYISDKRIELAPGLVWCGSMNILPTEDNPISGLETYGGADSIVFPHAKIEMRSIATMPDMPVKMIYTTGAITLMNYLQKKLGIKAEHHHRYGFLLVEVDAEGNWWVRQVASRKSGGVIQDLNVIVENGAVVSTEESVDAITWGDLHATNSSPEVVATSMNMLDTLCPKYQFIHDVMEGISTSRHQLKHKDPHTAMHRWLRGLHRVSEELRLSREVLEQYLRPWCKTIAPNANHDAAWLFNWLAKYDYRLDPANAQLFLRMQNFVYEQLSTRMCLPKDINIMRYAFEKEAGLKSGAVKFLLPDESFTVGEVECGCHGHLGPNGSFGSPSNLAKIGKKATTAHTHSAGIFHGLYVAGTSSKLTRDWGYTTGPSSWSWSHVVQYKNGQRTIITLKNGKWKA
jgi:hypothetical protein